ncbi:hypothetical protein [Myxococcus guangdongensis]|uniref:hypothetical protein n=1 Tax=Myxococcus guangdongensis TaxID=2906760 RepID=UPI003898F3E4
MKAFEERAHKAGAMPTRRQHQPWGDMTTTYEDPEGYTWMISQHMEDVPEGQISSRVYQNRNY